MQQYQAHAAAQQQQPADSFGAAQLHIDNGQLRV